MIEINGSTEITNHNMGELCHERFCDNKEEFFWELKIGDTVYYLNVCAKHNEQVDKDII